MFSKKMQSYQIVRCDFRRNRNLDRDDRLTFGCRSITEGLAIGILWPDKAVNILGEELTFQILVGLSL
jgi:hypothetical protein